MAHLQGLIHISDVYTKDLARTTQDIQNLVVEGLETDGAHHKQWYLEQIAELVGLLLDEHNHEPGIAP